MRAKAFVIGQRPRHDGDGRVFDTLTFEIFREHGGAIGDDTATLERETLHVMDDKNAAIAVPHLDDPDMPRRLRNSRPSGLITVWCWPSSWSTSTP